ncbi:hypothetical protein TGGT1_258040 [Toxoplasma gondii GT1]|uniref:Uncharacterized protein n=1 Tax=Toxoplasma gondii (strain ATCC 50853 / GT1) TaxID=507601 RepID=S7UZ42_TOXGG|nr:hypothetical protein TGGT1_258040 [Toxoplasma gondii GT1]
MSRIVFSGSGNGSTSQLRRKEGGALRQGSCSASRHQRSQPFLEIRVSHICLYDKGITNALGGAGKGGSSCDSFRIFKHKNGSRVSLSTWKKHTCLYTRFYIYIYT